MRPSSTRLATAAGLLVAATAWASPAAAQVSFRGQGGPVALRAQFAPAVLVEGRIAGAAAAARPTFMLQQHHHWVARPLQPGDAAASGRRADPLLLTTELRPSGGALPAPMALVRRVPLSFGVADLLSGFHGRRALHHAMPGLKSASRVFRLGGSVSF